MKAVLVLALMIGVLGVVGCGGDDEEDEGSAATAAETVGTATEAGGAADGASVFTSAGCGNCHTLEAAGSTGSVGPNLDDLQPDTDRVAEQVRSGGGGMPAFEGELSDAEIEAVAEYVSTSAGGGSSASSRYP